MDIKNFLSMVLPPSGEYYILGGKKGLQTSTCDSVDGAVALINQYKKGGGNVYIGLAGYRPGATREKKHVTGKKCFYFDMDCGEGKPYQTKQEAFAAVKKFLTDSKFPAPSMIVDSGGGLHIYWVTNEVLIESEWSSMALGLKRLAATHALRHDAAICADSARILRVPGTFNWKDPANPRECKVIKNTGLTYDVDALRKFLPTTTNVVAMPGFEKFQDGGFDNLIATTGSQPRFMRHILQECKVAQHTKDTAGDDADYNLWFAMLTLLLFCEDGEGFVHPFSNGHPKYDAGAVARKWQGRLADKAAGTTRGATTCEQFHACKPELCESCPHWKSPERGSSWSSPIHFGLPPAKADVPPFPYLLLSDGNTGITVPNEDGGKSIELAFFGQVHNLQVFKTDSRTVLFWEYRLPSKMCRNVEMDAISLVDAKQFKKALLASGVILSDAETKGLRNMTESWVKTIQNRRGEIRAPSNYGWTREGGQRGFRHGDTVFWADGREQTVHTAVDTHSNPIGTRGTLDGWQRMVKYALQAKHVETEVLIAAGFAAPLIEMSHIEGAILSAVSLRSGTGKTTAMRLGQAIWGNPSTAMFSLSDTTNAILARMGMYNTLPAMWDDIRIPENVKEARQKVDMIYQITQGREKSRMTSSVELRNVASWRTLLVCSSNSGLSPYISMIDQGGTAAHHRILEMEVSPIDTTKACKPSVFNEVGDHYGHAGRVYAKWLLANYDTAKAQLLHNIDAISAKLDAKPEDRFTVTTIAAIYTAAKLANQCGLVEFDTSAIVKFLVRVFQKRKGEIQQISRDFGSDNNIVELLGMFMAEHQMNTTIMRQYPKAGRNSLDNNNLVNPAMREVFLSVALEDKEIRILKSKVDKWFKGHSRLNAARELCDVDGITQSRRNISGAVAGDSKTLSCYLIEYTAETAILFGEYNLEGTL